MNTLRPPTPVARAGARRARFGMLTGVLLLAATASLVVANVLAARFSVRLDATALREHRLSPRSVGLLAGLKGDFEVVVAAPLHDRRTIDPQAVERLREVLDQFRRGAASKLQTTIIDTGSPAGLGEFESLLKRLADRDSGKIKEQTQSLTAAIAGAEQLADWLDALSPRLQTVRDAIPPDAPAAATNRSYFDQRATESRLNARSLRELTEKSKAALAAPTGQLPVPDLERAAAPLRQPLADIQSGLADVADNTLKFAGADNMPGPARDAAKPIADLVAQGRDRAATLRDALERVGRLDLLRIARSLQSGSATLVIGPPEAGVTAIDQDRLLPAPTALGAQTGLRADIGRNAEELIATALASLSRPVKPVIVFMHGQPIRGLLQSPDFTGLLDRMALRGIDMAEWAVCVDAEPPPLTKFDPAGTRPVVYVALSTDSSANVGARGQSGPERAAKLAKAIGGLVTAGKPVLLSLNPSTLPTFGEPDPMVGLLSGFGLTADSGHPLLKERFTAGGRHVDAYQSVVAETPDHPIAKAVRALPTRFEWSVPIARAAGAPTDSAFVPLYVTNDKAVWAESQWLGYWQVRLQDHESVPNKPSRDARDLEHSAWTIAAAASRPLAGQGQQRLVVVGSNTWFMDRVAQERTLVDGRPAFTNPGNSELFEASVYWLAGQDDMIAASATARAVPLIRPLRGGTVLAWRWLAIAGLPGGVLLAGMVWRLLRG